VITVYLQERCWREVENHRHHTNPNMSDFVSQPNKQRLQAISGGRPAAKGVCG
jgi:hypothetical protein